MPSVPQQPVLMPRETNLDGRDDKMSSQSEMVSSTVGSTEANSGTTSSPGANGGNGGAGTSSQAEPQKDEIADRPRDHTLQDAQEAQPMCGCGKCDGSLNIDANATMLDGIRSLLAHHLRNADVLCLSESQVELLEHHSARLASYAQKIVQTITFAQHVVSQVTDVQRNYQAREPPKEVPRKKPKKLKLSDGELLSIYGKARREAEKEADWRGLDENVAFDVRSNRMPAMSIQELVLEGSPDGKASVIIESATGGDTERKAAIGLLGQALAARDGKVDTEDLLREGAHDIAQRIIPASPLRPWDDRGYACCRPVLAGDGALPAQYMPMVPPESNSAAKAAT